MEQAISFKKDHVEEGGGPEVEGKEVETGLGSGLPCSASPCCSPKLTYK